MTIPTSVMSVVISSNKSVLMLGNDLCSVVDWVLLAMLRISGGEINSNMRELCHNSSMINFSEWCVS